MDVSHTANYCCAVSGTCLRGESDILRTKHPPPLRISTLANKTPLTSSCIILDDLLPVSHSML